MLGVQKMTEPTEKEKQITFLKEHESELTEYIKNRNPKSKISKVDYEWNSFKVEDSGAFTQKLYTLKINLYDSNKNEIDGGVITIIPDDINMPSEIKELSTNNFDRGIGEKNNG
ncbi:hypothetical protein RV18_GL003623 [Enterococcus termitis]|nr:hypothetical protein RV18_GL003623 [Enterococcus termitis]